MPPHLDDLHGGSVRGRPKRTFWVILGRAWTLIRPRERKLRVPSPGYATGRADRPALPRRSVRLPGQREHRVRDGRELERQRPALRARVPPGGALRVQGALRWRRLRGPDVPGVLRCTGPGRRAAAQLHALTGGRGARRRRGRRTLLVGQTGAVASAQGIRMWAGRIADSSTSTWTCWRLSTGPWPAGPRWTCPAGGRIRRRTASPAALVDSIVLEVPHTHPQLRPGARTGVWAATKLATDAGGGGRSTGPGIR